MPVALSCRVSPLAFEMKAFYSLLLVFFSSLLCVQGQINVDTDLNRKINLNKPLDLRKYAYHAELFQLRSVPPAYFCAGSIVHEQFVLTARACVKELTRNMIKVGILNNKTNKFDLFYHPLQIITTSDRKADWALIKLPRMDLTVAKEIDLNFDLTERKPTFHLLGKAQDEYFVLRLSALDDAHCQKALIDEKRIYWASSTGCASILDSRDQQDVYTDPHDMGSALVEMGVGGMVKIHGVLSGALYDSPHERARPKFPVFYTRMFVYSYDIFGVMGNFIDHYV